MATMQAKAASRIFANIPHANLRGMLEAEITDSGIDEFLQSRSKDVKVNFSTENTTFTFNQGPTISKLLGYNTLSNGLTFYGMRAGGDWEVPVFFIIYFDGARLRVYIPTDGNPWNTATKRAYGNSDREDEANAFKRFGTADLDEIEPNEEMIEKDILARFTKVSFAKNNSSTAAEVTQEAALKNLRAAIKEVTAAFNL